MSTHSGNPMSAENAGPRTARGAYLQLLRALSGLIAGWWRSDRIRISPREGELLRLQPGSILMVNGIVAEIRSRAVIHASRGNGVHYECQTEHGSARLKVPFPDGEQRVDIIWSAAGRNQSLLECQIEVFG
jgi:hypothetical protein